MIDHVTIRVRDLDESKLFYEKAFEPLGWKVAFGEAPYFWAFDIGNGLFEIAQHKDTQVITSTHIAFRVSHREKVDAFFKAVLAAGATDNGAPGPRSQYTPNYYAYFILDPSGHNIEAMIDQEKDGRAP